MSLRNPAALLSAAIEEWQSTSRISRRRATVIYHGELAKIVRENWPEALEVPCDELTTANVVEFVERVSRYSSPRFNGLVSILRALVPAASFLKRRKVRPKVVILPDETRFQRVLAELDSAHRGHSGLVVRLLATTGLRIGEARALAWRDLMPEGILVRRGKTDLPRLVPYVGNVREVLERLRAIADGRETILPHASVKTALAGACRRAGVALLTHHDFRRLFATRCIESGVDLPTAARWLGHRDGGALLGRTYFHLMSDHQKAMAARVQIST